MNTNIKTIETNDFTRVISITLFFIALFITLGAVSMMVSTGSVWAPVDYINTFTPDPDQVTELYDNGTTHEKV